MVTSSRNYATGGSTSAKCHDKIGGFKFWRVLWHLSPETWCKPSSTRSQRKLAHWLGSYQTRFPISKIFPAFFFFFKNTVFHTIACFTRPHEACRAFPNAKCWETFFHCVNSRKTSLPHRHLVSCDWTVLIFNYLEELFPSRNRWGKWQNLFLARTFQSAIAAMCQPVWCKDNIPPQGYLCHLWSSSSLIFFFWKACEKWWKMKPLFSRMRSSDDLRESKLSKKDTPRRRILVYYAWREVFTINDRNVCERRSCMKNNGKSPTFKFVSREARRPSEVQRVSRGWRRPGAALAPRTRQRISLGSENDWKFRLRIRSCQSWKASSLSFGVVVPT